MLLWMTLVSTYLRSLWNSQEKPASPRSSALSGTLGAHVLPQRMSVIPASEIGNEDVSALGTVCWHETLTWTTYWNAISLREKKSTQREAHNRISDETTTSCYVPIYVKQHRVNCCAPFVRHLESSRILKQ